MVTMSNLHPGSMRKCGIIRNTGTVPNGDVAGDLSWSMATSEVTKVIQKKIIDPGIVVGT